MTSSWCSRKDGRCLWGGIAGTCISDQEMYVKTRKLNESCWLGKISILSTKCSRDSPRGQHPFCLVCVFVEESVHLAPGPSSSGNVSFSEAGTFTSPYLHRICVYFIFSVQVELPGLRCPIFVLPFRFDPHQTPALYFRVAHTVFGHSWILPVVNCTIWWFIFQLVARNDFFPRFQTLSLTRLLSNHPGPGPVSLRTSRNSPKWDRMSRNYRFVWSNFTASTSLKLFPGKVRSCFVGLSHPLSLSSSNPTFCTFHGNIHPNAVILWNLLLQERALSVRSFVDAAVEKMLLSKCFTNPSLVRSFIFHFHMASFSRGLTSLHPRCRRSPSRLIFPTCYCFIRLENLCTFDHVCNNFFLSTFRWEDPRCVQEGGRDHEVCFTLPISVFQSGFSLITLFT